MGIRYLLCHSKSSTELMLSASSATLNIKLRYLFYLYLYMDHLADSIAILSQGMVNWYLGREGVPVDDSSGGKCEPVMVFECIYLSIDQ